MNARLLLSLCVTLLVGCGVALAQDVSPQSATGAQQISALIDQLGHDSYQTREAAMAKLIGIGRSAEPAVEKAINAPDPEVAYRARKVLKEIDRSLLAERRAAFLAGDVEKLKTNAESWQRMEELIGNTQESRELFVQMQIAAEDLLTAAEEDPQRCASKISQLYNEDQQARRFGGGGLPAGVVAAMVFVGSDDNVPLDAATMSRCTSLLYRHKAALGDDDVFRELLGGWINTKATGTQQYQLLRLAQQFKLDEGLELARRMIDGAAHTPYKVHAVMTIGMMGGPDDVAELEKLIHDNTRVGSIARGKVRMECKLGDVALAMAIALSEKKAKEFGFPNAPDGRPTNTSYHNYAFVDDAQRQAARKKWDELKEEQ